MTPLIRRKYQPYSKQKQKLFLSVFTDKTFNIIRWFSWIIRRKQMVESLLSDDIHERAYHIHQVTDRAYKTN